LHEHHPAPLDERALARAEIVLTVGLIAVLGAGVKRRRVPR
jgi:hypothetical protein